ncbi:MAG TPA: GNAT family protein [Patescibacteria group bacterium]|nr:GNAT family protein [Patescibacteria group bacterium]
MSKILIKVDKDLYLKTWSLKNSAELFALTDKNRAYLQPWLPWVPNVKTEADSKKFIRESLQEMKDDKGIEMGIWLADKLVGCIGLHGLSKPNRRASLGYWLSKNQQKKGIMTRSVKALVDYSFKILNLNRIGLEASTENVSSCAIAKKLGFVKEGVVRQFEFVDGRFLDCQVCSVLKSEWK